MNLPTGILAIFVYFSLLILALIPLILLRRLWNSRQAASPTANNTERQQTTFPKYFTTLVLVNIGALLLYFWAMAICQTVPNSPAQIMLATIGAAINGPWLLALLYNWKKGIFNRD